MQAGKPLVGDGLPVTFKQARICEIAELETGAYWAQLQPHFMRPYFRRLTYRLAGKGWRDLVHDEALSVRGAGSFGDLDIGYVRDRYATELSLIETGLPHYCLTSVTRGAVEYRPPDATQPVVSDKNAGLVYRGLPDTRLRSTDDGERLAIWTSAQSLEQRLSALMGEPPRQPLSFAPVIEWESASGQTVKRLLRFMTEELNSPHSVALSGIAGKSFEDLFLYTLLQCLPHNHTVRLGPTAHAPVPRSIRRAEEFIHARAGLPIALHEVAAAAGCSVRSLQLGFRQFRQTTPAAAIRKVRLEAARQALTTAGAAGTVTGIAHQFGFSNPSRFTQLYRQVFGRSPAEELQRRA
ncbi:MAG TPA: AraC family transcriptional regulator [Rhodopila sp.]|nr:AraC family transcriptional regulator [Rhodopila sp.]